jgi:23S rRNA pseudouridine1911/1915/1917 synthase
MHTAPLKEGEQGTLLDWTASRFPELLEVKGRKTIEGGLLHRLDYETGGLVLIARNQYALENLRAQQKAGNFIKEYLAFSTAPPETRNAVKGFPPYSAAAAIAAAGPAANPVHAVESAFRPYGPGRKQVRPVSSGRVYRTEYTVLPPEAAGVFSAYVRLHPEGRLFTVTLVRGFRHQIRCHLAWLGWPLLNDPLYGGDDDGGFLALRAHALSFTDPDTGEPGTIRLP